MKRQRRKRMHIAGLLGREPFRPSCRAAVEKGLRWSTPGGARAAVRSVPTRRLLHHAARGLQRAITPNRAREGLGVPRWDPAPRSLGLRGQSPLNTEANVRNRFISRQSGRGDPAAARAASPKPSTGFRETSPPFSTKP